MEMPRKVSKHLRMTPERIAGLAKINEYLAVKHRGLWHMLQIQATKSKLTEKI